MKKTLVIFIMVCLLFGMSSQVLAGGKIYIDYECENGTSLNGPTLGCQWDINTLWLMALEIQMNQTNDDDMVFAGEVTRTLYSGTTAALRIESGDTKNLARFEVINEYFLPRPFLLQESICYTVNDYVNNSAYDYQEIQLYLTLVQTLNNKTGMLWNVNWKKIRYSDLSKRGLGYEEWVLAPKLRYTVNEQLEVLGGCLWKANSKLDDRRESFVIRVNYFLKNYTFYFEFISPTTDDTSKIGVSYEF